MAAFRYVAVDTAGTTHRGTMEAASEARVIESLQRKGFIPLKAEPDRGGGLASQFLTLDVGRGGAFGKSDLANITRELATMLGAGQNLDAALRFLIETSTDDLVYVQQASFTNRVGAPQTGAFPANVSARYVRITVVSTVALDAAHLTWASFYEFSVTGI